ncbi:hypothetical protein JAAARDRAFT_61533 [Jaapia argillacea MUCL 33604]|uniref:Serine/threonine-protein kinase TOR n=1 Tax=Jaapia argillacea MUCL 33604 TaxID=933084 RepID=A0A067PDI9_9AGAM|nr:hypothetical protein JAAARDRAFT_61533 [Jaapia argillacea MUCL 33604]
MASTAPSSGGQMDVLSQIFQGLKSKVPEVRSQSAQELRRYVNHLLDVDPEETIESKMNLFRFYNYVKPLLPNNDINVMLAASKTLGQIAEIGGATFGERFMEKEVQTAIELLQGDRQEPGRYAGVLILKELARNSPTYFHSHIGLVFDKILVPLRDSRVIVREGAAELLAACLEIITQRERGFSLYLPRIFQDAQLGLKMTQPEIIHGSLLTYRELLLHGGSFMKEAFLDTADQILKFRTHRDALVKKMDITLIPTLAVYDTQTFSEHFLHKAMAHLLTQLDRPSERSFAFIAIGHVASAVGSEMKPFVDAIMGQVKGGLQSRGKKNAPSEEPMFQCVGMLASAVGPNLTKLLHDQLDLMFACGLSEPLRQALVAIARHIPPLLKTIQDRLLDLLSITLSGQPYKPLGAPTSLVRPDIAAIAKDINATQVRWVRHVLNEFVRTCAMPYLEDDHAEVRRAAATTCCRLFIRDPICYQASNHAIEIISDVLDKLLTVGIADPDASIRQTVLSSLHERFDKHLAQAENVRSLFIALNDEVFENRLTAVTLIGRLAMHNPAYVMPSLRKALIQLVTELEYSTVTRSREECTRLLTTLVSATQRLIKPYAVPMLRVLLQKAGDPNPTVAAHVIMCLGELTCAGGEEVVPHVPELMGVIISKLSDPSLAKRDAALRTLGQVCSSTGYVIAPLIDYPTLLNLLGKILKAEPTQHVRRGVIKVLGILGALDPYRRKTKPEDEAGDEKAVTAVNTVPLTQSVTSTASDDYYQTVVINALLGVLKDQSLSSHHHHVIEAIMSIFKTQGLKCVTFLPQVGVRVLVFALEFHLQQLAILVGIIKQHVRNYTPEVFGLITELWESLSLQLPIVSLVEALGKALDAEFKPFLPTILPLMLKVFDGELNDKRANTQMKVFDALLTFGSNIEEYLHLVIPIITVDGLSRKVNFSDHASRIIHPLNRVLGNANNEVRMAFMEHEEKPLPIENRTLGEYAMKYHAYAKALHYKELEFFSETSPTIIEALIGINTKLQQQDAAWGTLIIAREQYDVTKHEEWYERLGRWQEALVAYEKKAEEDPDAPDIAIGRMKCLHALGEWDQLAAQVEENWANANHEDRREIAPMAAAAAWSLNEWDSMDDYIATMRADSPDRAFYRAILSVHQNQFPKALAQIAKARDLLDPELTSFVAESYSRSYNIMVRAQMLSELEEIIAYKQYADQPERQQTMRKTWMKRLQGCQPDVEVWQRILQVRTFVLAPEDDPVMWIKFANLCRKSDRMALAEKTIKSLLSPDRLQQQHHSREHHHMKAPPDVVYAQLKYMWATGAREESLNFLRQFSASLSRDLQSEAGDRSQRPGVSKQTLEELSRLLARCYFKQGEWQVDLKEDWSTRNINDILHAYFLATHYDPTWYKAWHTWALSNFEVINFLENQNEGRVLDVAGSGLVAHIVSAVQGFFRSISLRSENALQDTLRLLTLWFKFGAHDEISHAMGGGFATVDVDTWLEVIPQIIARIQTPSTNIRRNIDNLLTDVGKHHPQALIYPLTVASKSSSASRKNAALAIIDRMREHSPIIVEQALVVSQELIRVAILWHELWHEGLEEASRLYFTEKNPEGMIVALEPLHDMLEAGPTTARETSFAQVFGRDLHEAREACRRYRIYGDTSELDKAWDIYYGVFKKVAKQLPQLTTLDLQYVSPELLKARHLELAVPGTYQSGRPIIKITSFATKFTVISSRQRPRRFSLKGSDGRDYQYLLKGHEDLRQDERVMQLFSLVNTLLSIDTNSYKRRLHIQRYSMAPDYENLILLQKVEVFEYALENTTGQDLYRVLWLKSANSEHWLERRATYTRSLAVNSVVGHVLGLGDRHPSNILLERKTGKVVHIDFGDCFEVAMHREKFPEKIPFRLTRMLTHAMEVSGIEGSFRNTCEITMQVLRDNKESLMAVLEAFVYDPLINWRLMQHDVEGRRGEGPTRKLKADENDIFNGMPAFLNLLPSSRPLDRDYRRAWSKTGSRDFTPDVVLTVQAQVDKLILQATSLENLCQCFSGWCAFW